MKKVKRILAICGVIFLLSLYVITLLCAIFDPTSTQSFLYASLVATVIIPVLMWAYGMIYRMTHKNPEENREDE